MNFKSEANQIKSKRNETERQGTKQNENIKKVRLKDNNGNLD